MTRQSKLVQWNCEGLKQKGDALQEIIREKTHYVYAFKKQNFLRMRISI